MKAKTIAYAVVVLGAAIIARDLFPKTVTKTLPPIFKLVHDTVQAFDTVRVKAAIKKTKPDTTWLERFTVTPPETVAVAPNVSGVERLLVGKLGDTTVAYGHELLALDQGYQFHEWRATWYTPGPLQSLSFDSLGGVPLASFGPPPPKGCGFFCAAKKYAVGGVTGFAACKVGL